MPLSLLLKLVLTPALIAGATLVGRRWGGTLSGWLVGLPFTSAPVIFFLALEQGSHFAAIASLGVVLGVTSQAAFAVAYVRAGGPSAWQVRVSIGAFAFALTTAAFDVFSIPALIEPLLVAASLVVSIALVPVGRATTERLATTRANDLPLRMVVATVLVVGLTAIAPLLGARLSGLLTPFPMYAAILAVFAHRRGGLPAATEVWRGLLYGLFAFLVFFTVIAATIERTGVAAAFLLAIAAALGVQAVTLQLLRSGSR